jgi:RNA polymerase sigma-70 factor, ECF subfamily
VAELERIGAANVWFDAVDLLTRLALRARAGDPQAAGGFVEAGYQEVWRFCASLVSQEAADDLCQETFARAIKALPKFRGESSARTWLLSIARRTCADELRARTRRRRQNALAAAARAVAATDPSSGIAVADFISRLEGDRRTAFVLTQVLGLSYAEAAEVCGCPTGTIRSRVARARADLLALLQSAGDAERRHA